MHHHPDSQHAGEAPRCVAGHLHRRFGGIDCLARLHEKCLPRLGEGDCARRPVQQLHVERLFETANVATQGWLVEAKSLGCAREVQLLGDSDEIAELPQLDVHTS